VAVSDTPERVAMTQTFALAGVSGVFGAAVMYLLHLHFSAAWQSVYTRFPWSGYETAMASGNVVPYFSESPLALGITLVALLAMGALLGSVFRRPLLCGVMAWSGVQIAAFAIARTGQPFHENNPLLPIFVAVLTAAPIALGVVAGPTARRRLGRGTPKG
jgi:hypothetical protein